MQFFKRNKKQNAEVVIQTTSDNALQELLKKVRRIEIKARHFTNDIMAGNYHTAFKGRGMSFSEVREYAYGDDVRNIDWNVSARFNHPYIKVFEEERELTLMLMVDISASNLFGTGQNSKQNIITEISAILAFSAIKNNDMVGAIFFSDKVKKYIPPAKGSSHVLYIVRELLSLNNDDASQTNIAEALKFLNATQKRKAITFLLSDFISTPYEKEIKVTARKHTLNAIMLYDNAEKQMPQIGIIKIKDLETQKEIYVDTSSQLFQKNINTSWQKNYEYTKLIFEKINSKFVIQNTATDYIPTLQKLLRK